MTNGGGGGVIYRPTIICLARCFPRQNVNAEKGKILYSLLPPPPPPFDFVQKKKLRCRLLGSPLDEGLPPPPQIKTELRHWLPLRPR